VLQRARRDLERFYPTVNGKPTVAYLWARTVACKNCRATVPLLKTRWLCKKEKKRVLLTMAPNPDKSGVVFGVQTSVPMVEGSAAARRQHDKQIGSGTMSRSGVTSPGCGTIMTMEDLRLEGRAGRLGAVLTTVVVDNPRKNKSQRLAEDVFEPGDEDNGGGKEYRLPIDDEIRLASEAEQELEHLYAEIPFGVPEEAIVEDAKRNTWCVPYGVNQFYKLFTPRQLLALGTFVKHSRAAREAMRQAGYPAECVEAVGAYLALAIDRLADRGSSICTWTINYDQIRNTFVRFALPITWDFAESIPSTDNSGGYPGAIEWIAMYLSHAMSMAKGNPQPVARQGSATIHTDELYDVILTDPPYYDAIGYSVLMDFFYVWLRRTLHGLSPELDAAFHESLAPKWDHERQEGELIDDASRFGGDKARSRAVYEDGMYRAFTACRQLLKPDGRLVLVFANKQADAWETLVSALIRAGFVVTASWRT
jgi:putative DNA methylase